MSEEPGTARPKKQKKKQNALKHGAFSRELMLPGEKLRDYDALRADTYEEWLPDGPSERELVNRLVVFFWQKQRLDRYERLILEKSINQIHAKSEDTRHRQNLKKWGPEFSAAGSVDAVERMLSLFSPLYRATIIDWVPLETCQDPASWGAAIGNFLSRLADEEQMEDSDKFMAIMNPDLIEKGLDRSDRLDEKIDRTIKRLMQVKLAKQISRNMTAKPQPKLINPPASADTKPILEGKSVTHTLSVVPAEVSVVPAEVMTEPERGATIIDEIEWRDEIAPAMTKNEQSDPDRVKVAVLAKPELFSTAEMETFFAKCDELRAREGYVKGEGFLHWL
jgi:hypothetical protein